MDALENIFTRTSIREFSDEPLNDDELQTILKAGMSGPSCVNSRDWAFLVVRDKQKLEAMAKANGAPAKPLLKAAAGILVAGDLQRAFAGAQDYWIIDGAIACQNMILAGHALGIGSVWLGTYPQMERVERQRELFALPGHIVPHSIIAFGHPLREPEPKGFYEEERVHYEKW